MAKEELKDEVKQDATPSEDVKSSDKVEKAVETAKDVVTSDKDTKEKVEEVKDVVTSSKDKKEVAEVEDEDFQLMPEDKARELTNSIQSTAIATCILLQKAHDLKAYKSLGYKTWGEYIDKEFKFSRARSYQLLSQGKVINEISEASGSDIFLTEKEANQIKKELPYITEKIKAETKDEKDPEVRSTKAKEIVEDQAAKDAAAFEKKTDAAPREDNTVATKAEPAVPQAPAGPETEVSEEDKEKHQQLEEDKQTAFYFDNLERTLSVFPAMPTAKSLADAEKLDPERMIELRNSLKYAITWSTDLLARLEKKEKGKQ